MKKRWVLLFGLMLLVFMLAGCDQMEEMGIGEAQEEMTGESPLGDQEMEEITGGEETTIREDIPARSEESRKDRPVLELGTMYIREGNSSGDLVYVTGSHDNLRLSRESRDRYPELADSLDEYMTQSTKDVKTMIADYARTYKEDSSAAEFAPSGYEITDKLYVRRADRQVVSCMTMNYSFEGGAHGYYAFGGLNWDAATGKTISLDDVIADRDLLGQRIKEELTERYPDVPFFDFMDETIDNSVQEKEEHTLNWVLEPHGITFFFNPYDIGPYMAGAQIITLLYDNEDDLFTDSYRPEKEGFIFDLPTDTSCFVDVDHDNRADCIRVSCDQYEEEGRIEEISVSVNKKKLTLEDTSCYRIEPKVVMTAEGNVYLYAWCSLDNDYVNMHIFDLSSGNPISLATMDLSEGYFYTEEEGTDYPVYKTVLSDPAGMYLATRIDLLSTYDAGKIFHVENDPVPVSEESYYTIIRDLTLVTKKEIVTDMVDEEGNVTKSREKIPAGSSLKLYRSDGASLVDVLLTDGRIARLMVNDDYPQTIDGINVEDIFEELFYAG